MLITLLTIILIIVLTFTIQVQLVDASAVIFNMDTLPENQGWTINKQGGVSSSVSNGILTIENNGGIIYYSSPADWNNTVNNTKGWVVEFRLKLQNFSSRNPLIHVPIHDNYYNHPIQLYGNRITAVAVLATFEYLMNTTDNFHVYKFIGRGSILRVFVDEKVVLDVPYGAPSPGTLPNIDIASTVAYTKSYWDYFSYDTNPNLTLTFPGLTVIDGTSSYYISNLTDITVDNSNVVIPNGTYAGWCVDKSVVMIRNVTHDVILYSSINSSLPGLFGQINWSCVNYILNHKQGSMQEIQNAIWNFVPDHRSPPLNETVTWNMINAARANSNYKPGKGDTMAIIAYAGHNPGTSTSGSGVQNTIIEYRVP